MSSPERTERPNPAVLLIAHGSRHAPANDDLFGVAERFAARGDYPVVEPCFLELADPDIAAGGARCVARGATLVLMTPYFLSVGVHMLRDLTAARDDLAARHPGVEFRLGTTLGPHPLLDELVAVRVRELDAPGPPPGSPRPRSSRSVTPPWATNRERRATRIDTICPSD